jgi:hypothetical protein
VAKSVGMISEILGMSLRIRIFLEEEFHMGEKLKYYINIYMTIAIGR